MGSSDKKAAPNVGQRQKCYAARDEFYKCLMEHNDSEDQCVLLKEKYTKNCLQSWVKYFDKKRIYDDYKKKLEKEGYQPLEIKIK